MKVILGMFFYCVPFGKCRSECALSYASVVESSLECGNLDDPCIGAIFLFAVSLFCIRKPSASMGIPLAYHTMKCILTLFRFRLKGEEQDQISAEPCAIVCNRLSRFDPMVIFVLLWKRKLAFREKGTKPEKLAETCRNMIWNVCRRLRFCRMCLLQTEENND